MRTLLTLSILVALSGTAMAATAEMNITVPYECMALAQRNGVEVVIHGRLELARAVLKLSRAKASAPDVSECRAAIRMIRRSR